MLYFISVVIYLIYLLIIYFIYSHKIIRHILAIFGFLLLIYTTIYWVIDQFTNNGFTDSALFHLLYVIDLQTLNSFIFELTVASGYLLIISYITLLFFRYSKNNKTKVKIKYVNFIFFSILICTFITHPFSADIWNVFKGDPKPIYSFSRYYKNIDNLAEADHTYNLVYIYTESLESSFYQENKYPQLMPKMNKLRNANITINGIKQAPMTEWTIAGFVSSQCGIPLASDIRGRNNSLHWVESFLPKVNCIGDLLTKQGYDLTYVGGADLSFAGKGNFLRTHGFNSIFGKQEIQKEYSNKLSESKWGIYDDTTYQMIYDKFKLSVESQKKFALFGLSLDTHSPHGHISPLCRDIKYQYNDTPLLNAIHCHDQLLHDLIVKIMNYDAQNNSDTIIIIASDHLMMQNYIGLEENTLDRENAFLVIMPKAMKQSINRTATTLDIAPTMLSLIGYPINELGLGRNLLNTDSTTLPEELGQEEFFQELKAWRKDVWQFW